LVVRDKLTSELFEYGLLRYLSKGFQQYALNDCVGIWTDCVRILES